MFLVCQKYLLISTSPFTIFYNFAPPPFFSPAIHDPWVRVFDIHNLSCIWSHALTLLVVGWCTRCSFHVHYQWNYKDEIIITITKTNLHSDITDNETSIHMCICQFSKLFAGITAAFILLNIAHSLFSAKKFMQVSRWDFYLQKCFDKSITIW